MAFCFTSGWEPPIPVPLQLSTGSGTTGATAANACCVLRPWENRCKGKWTGTCMPKSLLFFQSPVTPCAGLEFQRRMRKSQGKQGIWTVATRVKKQRQRSERDVSTKAPGLSPQGKEFWASMDSITPLLLAGAMGTATVPRHVLRDSVLICGGSCCIPPFTLVHPPV